MVQDRLTHSKIDFTSEGTWQPNYTNLAGALTALGLAPDPERSSWRCHYHWHLTLYAAGKKVVIPRNIGLQNPPAMSSDDPHPCAQRRSPLRHHPRGAIAG